MKLTEICINRPVFATVLSIIIIVFGIIGYQYLDTRYFPNVSRHVMRISTDYTGASPRLIESTINTQIENALSSISGIDTLSSSANEGVGNVIVKFKESVNFPEKANEVRDKVAEIRNKLPAGADSPVVDVAGDDDWLMDVAFTNPNIGTAELRDYVDRYILDQIQEVPGVGSVELWGSNTYAMRIWLNPQKMAAYGVTVSDVKKVLEDNNIQLPAGKFKSTVMDFPITENTKLQSAKEFNNLIVSVKNEKIVRVSDIGNAELGLEDDPLSINLDGKPAIDMGIFLESGANPIAVSQAIRQRMDFVRSTLPNGMTMEPNFDISTFLKAAVKEVYVSIGLAILCVIAVIFLFLGSIRSVLTPIVTIPICVIGSFGIIALMGFSINMLTLLAIVLSIGLVVDDAVVMLENIYRHIENGLEPYYAALKGGKEIAFAVIAMTLTLVAVYAPIGFLQGRSALLFREFAFTLAGAVLLSGFVALTLSPSMCAYLLQEKKNESRLAIMIDRFFNWLRMHYRNVLNRALDRRLIIVVICCIIALGGVFIYKLLPQKFVPKEDMGFITVSINSPTGSNINYASKYVAEVQQQLSTLPEKKSIFGFAGYGTGGNGEVNLFLTPQDDRSRTAAQIADAINPGLQKIPGPSIFAAAFDPFSSRGGYDLSVHIMTSGSYDQLNTVMSELVAKLKDYPGLTNVDNSLKFDSQQYDVTVNRDLANSINVSALDIDDTLATLLGSSYVTDFYMGNKSYKVVLQADQSDLSDPTTIKAFYVKSAHNKMVSLDDLVGIKPVLEQQSLEHYDRLRSATLSAQLAPGYSLGTVVQYMQTNFPKWLPSNTKFEFGGRAKQMLESNSSMALIFGLSLVFIYLVLAAQFESFIDPFIVLFTVPLSIVGALLSLKLVGGSLNLYTDIGLITLLGLITKHGILITQFSNQLRLEGLSIREAVVKAASIRLRPILMTTGAMVLGALPLAFATGIGANCRREIGTVIVGGVFFGTFFSLILVPVAYSYFGKFKKFKLREQQIIS